MSTRYYKVEGYVKIEDTSYWEEGADETFSVARKISDYPAKWWSDYKEVSEEEYTQSERVLTPEGGV